MSVRLKIRRETVKVVVPIPKGYVPTLAVCLLNSTEFEADTTSPQYRDISLYYSAGGHVYITRWRSTTAVPSSYQDIGR